LCTLYETISKIPPRLDLQVWDGDSFSKGSTHEVIVYIIRVHQQDPAEAGPEGLESVWDIASFSKVSTNEVIVYIIQCETISKILRQLDLTVWNIASFSRANTNGGHSVLYTKS
jgi:hypothetical protein